LKRYSSWLRDVVFGLLRLVGLPQAVHGPAVGLGLLFGALGLPAVGVARLVSLDPALAQARGPGRCHVVFELPAGFFLHNLGAAAVADVKNALGPAVAGRAEDEKHTGVFGRVAFLAGQGFSSIRWGKPQGGKVVVRWSSGGQNPLPNFPHTIPHTFFKSE